MILIDREGACPLGMSIASKCVGVLCVLVCCTTADAQNASRNRSPLQLAADLACERQSTLYPQLQGVARTAKQKAAVCESALARKAAEMDEQIAGLQRQVKAVTAERDALKASQIWHQAAVLYSSRTVAECNAGTAQGMVVALGNGQSVNAYFSRAKSGTCDVIVYCNPARYSDGDMAVVVTAACLTSEKLDFEALKDAIKAQVN